MNEKNHAEVQQLKLHLQQHPEQAFQLAIDHLYDYLILLNECRHLDQQVELLRQSKAPSISLDNFINTQLTLPQQFRVEVFKRSLVQKPHKSQFWAVEYFKLFLHLNESCLAKRAKLISLQNQPSLPYFL
jgi:hypothetical protein